MENRRVLIDTSVIIKFIRSTKKQETLLWELMEHFDCFVSVITIFELYNGIKISEHNDILEKIFRWIKIIEFNKEMALKSSEIYRNLIKENKIIEFRDIFIAATSIIFKIPLSTLNKTHFERIKGIDLIV